MKENSGKEIVEPVKPIEPIIPQKEDYEITAEKILKKNGTINNRNSAYIRGMEGFVKDVSVGNGKVYVLLEIRNKTNFNY